MTRIHINSGRARRPKPKVGDRKFIGGVEHVRVHEQVKSGPYRGSYVHSNGRPCYEWIPLDKAPEYLRDNPGRLVGQRPGYKVPAK